jgi:hypothetical protein
MNLCYSWIEPECRSIAEQHLKKHSGKAGKRGFLILYRKVIQINRIHNLSGQIEDFKILIFHCIGIKKTFYEKSNYTVYQKCREFSELPGLPFYFSSDDI